MNKQNSIVQAWEDAGQPHPFATFRDGYVAAHPAKAVYVDCGNCPAISTGCEAGKCLNAAASAEPVAYMTKRGAIYGGKGDPSKGDRPLVFMESAPVTALESAAREVLDTELGEMAWTGSDAPVEHALGLLADAVAGRLQVDTARPRPLGSYQTDAFRPSTHPYRHPLSDKPSTIDDLWKDKSADQKYVDGTVAAMKSEFEPVELNQATRDQIALVLLKTGTPEQRADVLHSLQSLEGKP